MPVPAHSRLTFSGTLGPLATPVEEWSFRLNLQKMVADSEAECIAAADVAQNAYATHLAPVMSTHTVCTRVRYSEHAAGGLVEKDSGGSYIQGDNTEVLAGSTALSGGRFPLQTALCVSLVTGRSGPRGRGRIFLPWVAAPLGDDYRISVAHQELVADAVQDFFDALNTVNDGNVVVASSYGFLTAVTDIKVGRVPDTQRSRRGALLEEYVTRPLAA